jgi:2-iminoacetate synthase ThiH
MGIETAEERVDHMLRARLQDETGGFGVHPARVPSRQQPDAGCRRQATDTLRVHAVARLMLDNIPT